jgi:hypothetical protein
MTIDGVQYVFDPYNTNWSAMPWITSGVDSDDNTPAWATNAQELGAEGVDDMPQVADDPRYIVVEGSPGGSIKSFDRNADFTANTEASYRLYAVTAHGVGILGFQESILQTFYLVKF